jgi:hypothetical protein
MELILGIKLEWLVTSIFRPELILFLERMMIKSAIASEIIKYGITIEK